MTTVGTLAVGVTADTRSLASTIARDSTKAGTTGGSMFGKAFGGVLAAGAAIGIGHALFSAVGGAISEASQLQSMQKQTAAVIKSTGGAANVSAAQIRDHAAALESVTTQDEFAIQNGENLLLTFKNIQNGAGKGNDIFDQTTKTMLDMSAAMGQDTKSSAIQLGKALNDPTKGMTALTRVGVTFTAGQTKQIQALQKSGDVMGAQKVILKELNSEFGGSAKAAGQGFAGAMFRAKDAVSDLLRDIATAALPVLTNLADFFSQTLIPAIKGVFAFLAHGDITGDLLHAFGLAEDSPIIPKILAMRDTFINAFQTIVGVVVPIVQKVVGVFISFIGWVSQFKGVLLPLVYVFTAIMVATKLYALALLIMKIPMMITIAQQWLLNAALTANPIGIVVVAIGALVGALVYAYTHFETFRNIVNMVWAQVKTVVTVAAKVIGAIIRWLVANVFPRVWEVMKQVWAAIQLYWRLSVAVIKVAWAVISAIVRAGVAFVMSIIHGIADIIGFIRGVWDAVVSVVKGAVDRYVDFVTGLKDRILGFFSSAGSWLLDAGKAIIQGLIDGFGAMIGALKDAWNSLIDVIPGGFADKFKIGSPSKLMMGFGKNIAEGLALGIHSGVDDVLGATSTLAGAAVPNTIRGSRMRINPANIVGADSGGVGVRVFIGETELTDIVRVETRRETAAVGARYTHRRN